MASPFESFNSGNVDVAQATIPVPDELSSAIGKVRPSLAGVGRVEMNQAAQVDSKTVGVSANGTAFVVDKNATGCLLYTKEHVVHDLRYGAMRDEAGTVAGPAPNSKGPEVTVTLPDLGKRKAQILLADQSTDSAILQIESSNPDKECRVVPLAKSLRDMKVNDLTITVGYDGKTGSLDGLTGIVGGMTSISGVEQAGYQVPNAFVNSQFVKNQDLIAIYKMAAPKGYSGGPTFNTEGEVIGANYGQVGTGTLLTPVDIIQKQLRRVKP